MHRDYCFSLIALPMTTRWRKFVIPKGSKNKGVAHRALIKRTFQEGADKKAAESMDEDEPVQWLDIPH